MHLRVTEETELNGLDLDQFFEEQIGDWSAFEQNRLQFDISSPTTPPVQEVPEAVDGVQKKA